MLSAHALKLNSTLGAVSDMCHTTLLKVQKGIC